MKEEDGFALSESRAILTYLAERYDEAGKLFPSEDVKPARAEVMMMLFFDTGALSKAIRRAFLKGI